MNSITKLFFCISILAFLGTGCESDSISPNNGKVEIAAKSQSGHHVPAAMTSTPVQVNLIDSDLNIIGTLEVAHNTDELYLTSSFTHGWMVSETMFYLGDHNNLPKGNGGTIELEEFPFQTTNAQPKMVNTIQLPIGALANCFDISYWYRAKQLDFFGNVIATTEGWATGTTILDGTFFQYCTNSVVTQSNSSNSQN